ncbi:hypothetical protein [Mucilaginibacter pedocola]|uniref:Glycoside hydrolase family 42 N-terminal domain-containing protein n=1 Tax=Mucilaginibacter pedocola TaxID=1792845 RepID=A0A1S9P7U1_9SPHI|nr:hypothetical protein [Mucilaginibacter pedocola]OOQ57016.1 hypothetical protein BC343_15875 [Mucilaginibacter pedocola]
MKLRAIIATFTVLFVTLASFAVTQKPKVKPKIVNIVNFIRLLEPREPAVTEDVLYQTVVKQVELMNKYKLRGTFLLQYDALMDARYQKLLKSLPAGSFEIGGWWEIPQPMVEKAGLKWRGRYPWDWHANIGFSTGYTPEEREKLADVYMKDFKSIFGYYPKSVASWFIDEHTLNYLYTKYHIIASANCKDQYGTDGYTLWGGYWNQAYYPSKVNSYMPAQNAANQIPVPIFRMLGSDPVRQYDAGLGTSWQSVITLEPVYKDAGGDAKWVSWFLKQLVEGEAMEFGYTQAGQENSFTWDAMAKGLEMQMPLIAKLRDEKKVTVETLAESGAWFSKQYKVTPATSVTVNEDLAGSNRQTVWFNSRFYRANLLWEDGTLRFRDIHLFNEKLPSKYLTQKVETNVCSFYTLPFVDGYLWSTPTDLAGLRFKTNVNGKEVPLTGGKPTITNPTSGVLQVSWPLASGKGTLHMVFTEKQLTVKVTGKAPANWFLDMHVSAKAELPFQVINASSVDSKFEGMDYKVRALSGSFSKLAGQEVFRLKPIAGTLTLNFVESR